MAASNASPNRDFRSFGLNISTLHTHLHEFINFSPRLQREFAARTTTPTEGSHNTHSHSLLTRSDALKEEEQSAQSGQARPFPLSNEFVSVSDDSDIGKGSHNTDSEEGSEDEIAQAIYGNLFGKPKLSQRVRRAVQKSKTTKARNQMRKAQDEKLAGKKGRGKGKDKHDLRAGHFRTGDEVKGPGEKTGVKMCKGKSYDGVTSHVTVKADRTKYGMFAGAARERREKRGLEDNGEEVNDGNENGQKPKKPKKAGRIEKEQDDRE
ncbi:MAG: hypothetical protein Q9165_005638 [Trypethelium subeluteriae]